MILHVYTGTTLISAADQNTYFACPDILKEIISLNVRFCIMDEPDLIFRDAFLNQAFLNEP